MSAVAVRENEAAAAWERWVTRMSKEKAVQEIVVSAVLTIGEGIATEPAKVSRHLRPDAMWRKRAVETYGEACDALRSYAVNTKAGDEAAAQIEVTVAMIKPSGVTSRESYARQFRDAATALAAFATIPLPAEGAANDEPCFIPDSYFGDAPRDWTPEQNRQANLCVERFTAEVTARLGIDPSPTKTCVKVARLWGGEEVFGYCVWFREIGTGYYPLGESEAFDVSANFGPYGEPKNAGEGIELEVQPFPRRGYVDDANPADLATEEAFRAYLGGTFAASRGRSERREKPETWSDPASAILAADADLNIPLGSEESEHRDFPVAHHWFVQAAAGRFGFDPNRVRYCTTAQRADDSAVAVECLFEIVTDRPVQMADLNPSVYLRGISEPSDGFRAQHFELMVLASGEDELFIDEEEFPDREALRSIIRNIGDRLAAEEAAVSA